MGREALAEQDCPCSEKLWRLKLEESDLARRKRKKRKRKVMRQVFYSGHTSLNPPSRLATLGPGHATLHAV
jgi:hypothetical protein